MSAKDDKCWDCEHTIGQHSGQHSGHGCTVDGCPCQRWYEIEPQPRIEFIDLSIVSDPFPEYEFKVEPADG